MRKDAETWRIFAVYQCHPQSSPEASNRLYSDARNNLHQRFCHSQPRFITEFLHTNAFFVAMRNSNSIGSLVSLARNFITAEWLVKNMGISSYVLKRVCSRFPLYFRKTPRLRDAYLLDSQISVMRLRNRKRSTERERTRGSVHKSQGRQGEKGSKKLRAFSGGRSNV